MKKIILLFIFIASGLAATAQDEAIFNHYLIDQLLISPAVAGFNESDQIRLHARAAWTGFPDAPRTFGATYNGPIGRVFGIGLAVTSDRAGALTRLRGQLNYAFRFAVQQDWKFAAGFSTEFQQITLDNTVYQESFYQGGDKIVEEMVRGVREFDASVGFYGTFRENTFASLTMANLVQSRLDNIAEESSGSFFQYYIFHAGHTFNIPQLKFTITPSLMLRELRTAPFQMDLNVMVGFLDDQLMAGGSYRILGGDSASLEEDNLGVLGLLLGTKLAAFEIYYGYDLSLQQFQEYNGGSHEVTISFEFTRSNKPNVYR